MRPLLLSMYIYTLVNLGKARVSKVDAYLLDRLDRLDESFASSNLRRITGLSGLKLKVTARLTVLRPRIGRGSINQARVSCPRYM